MTGFFKNLVDKLKGAPPAPQLYLGAFGKHPGWNDHLDDQGLETDRLIAIKRLLYVSGIGANIDAGAWDKLDPDQRLDAFHHAFLWYSPTDLSLGRFWASRDGKGRDKYPMVLAAQCSGLPHSWVLAQVAPLLEQTEQRCLAATTADAVIAALDADRAALRQLLPSPGTVLPEDPPLSPAALAALADCPVFAPANEGFFRILYQVSRALAAYLPGAPAKGRRPEHLRVPRCSPASAPDAPLAAAALWLRFLLTQLDPATSILLLAPLDHPFIDILVGDPTPAQLFCARAAPRAVPLTSDIPYTLTPQFTAAARDFLAACRVAPPNSPLPPTPRID